MRRATSGAGRQTARANRPHLPPTGVGGVVLDARGGLVCLVAGRRGWQAAALRCAPTHLPSAGARALDAF
eukprot:1341087-Pyramimonas_sp.AAC.1